MHLMTGRAELRRLLIAHKRFEKRPAMRLRIYQDREIVKAAHDRILARCQFMQLRIFKYEIALAHRALHLYDGMAHQAAEPCMCFRPVDDLLDRRIHHSAVEHCGIVASTAPLRGLRTDHILHVLDALPVPLIVERRQMMGRAVPLIVNIFVTTLACLRFHEVFRRNQLGIGRLSGAGKERAFRSVAFLRHLGGSNPGIADRRRSFPPLNAKTARA